jgi:hypothetical protein
VWRRKRRGIDAAIAQDHRAGGIDQEAGVEVAARPFRIDLELVGRDIDALTARQLLQRGGDATGNAAAGLRDPVGSRQAVRRALKREFRQHDEPRRIGGRNRRFDQRHRMRDIAVDDRPRAVAVGRRHRKLADGLNAARPPRLNGHRLAPQRRCGTPQSRSIHCSCKRYTNVPPRQLQ